ncbi:MAG: hypothetical protein IPI67_05685 [Myxococcales bacterium]|nr:hypothetical protein [Myxococcales bacterium]
MARVVAWFSVLLLVACGSASSRIASPDATSWESKVLGGAPDARLVLRLDRANADPVYGGPQTPYDRRSPSDPELEAFLVAVDSLELWFVADAREADRSSFLLVVRGKPDLERLKQQSDVRGLLSRSPERLPSGVLAYLLSDGATPAELFVLPSGTWVVAAGRIAGRVRYHLFSHAEDPPPAPNESDAILALWIGPGATRLRSVGKRAAGFEELSVIIRSSQRGDMELTVKFTDEKAAKAALAEVQTLLVQLPAAQKELADSCPAWEAVRFGLQRDGRAITGRVSQLPALIRAYRSGACRRSKHD